jgi:hypothetical protein
VMDPVLFSAPHLDLARLQTAELRHNKPTEARYRLILHSTSFQSIGWTTAWPSLSMTFWIPRALWRADFVCRIG